MNEEKTEKVKVGDKVLLNDGKIVIIEAIEKDDEGSGGWKLYCGQGLAFKRGSIKSILQD